MDDKVSYLAKSINIPNREFHFGHTKASPPSIETFMNDCEKKLSLEEVEELRAKGILLSNE